MTPSVCTLTSWFPHPWVSLSLYLGIGNGVGRQGRGNQPPINDTDRYGNSVSTPGATSCHGLAKIRREADMEFQYRHHIVDMDTDCGCHFCGRHFRDSSLSLSPLQLFWLHGCCEVAGVDQAVASASTAEELISSRQQIVTTSYHASDLLSPKGTAGRGRDGKYHDNLEHVIIRAVRLHNKIAPEECLYRCEKWFEKRKKDPKDDPKRVRKMLSPYHAA